MRGGFITGLFEKFIFYVVRMKGKTGKLIFEYWKFSFNSGRSKPCGFYVVLYCVNQVIDRITFHDQRIGNKHLNSE